MLSISDVAKRTELKTSAIRYYEGEGLLPKPLRQNGRRIYETSILDRLALIELAKAAGFSIVEIRHLQQGFSNPTEPGARWRSLAKHKAVELDQAIDKAQRMKQVLEALQSCECPTFEDCTRVLKS